MLNLKVGMSILALFFRATLLTLVVGTGLQYSTGLVISSPTEGEVVEGIVEIRGNLPANDFQSARLAYAYAGDAEKEWFLISKLDQPGEDLLLAAWDTTTITDGVYQLRLILKTTTGEKVNVITQNITVANYSSPEDVHDLSETVIPVLPTAELATYGLRSTPTPLAPNPAAISLVETRSVLIKGGMAGIGIIIFVKILSLIKNKPWRG